MPGSRAWVSNGLNGRQSEIFTEFPLKDSLKLLDGICCLLRNAERFQKLCSFARWRNNWAWHTIKLACAWQNLRLHWQVEMIYRIATKASFKFNEKMRCLFVDNGPLEPWYLPSVTCRQSDSDLYNIQYKTISFCPRSSISILQGLN